MNGEELSNLIQVHDQVARVYKDTRFPPANRFGGDLRMFAVTALWVIGVERAPRGQRIPRVCEVMHLTDFKFWELIRSDLPRYEPDSLTQREGCDAFLPRAKRRCGRGTYVGFRVTNPVDGTWEMVGYCGQHQEQARAAQDAERRRNAAGGIPDPLPNRGGLLPCYLPWKWEKNYAQADGSWKPPAVGICADDWPVLAKVEAANPTPPRFKVVFGGAELEIPGLDAADDSGPGLRLVTADDFEHAESP